ADEAMLRLVSSMIQQPAAERIGRRGKTPLLMPDEHAGDAASHSGTKSSIRVSIGRIEVRADNRTAPAPNAAPIRSSRPSPKLSLDEYLKRRNEGKI
ncbi:MAG TPA: hypothetical protein PKL29_04965, partial [Methanothrix sp.]|nr:hypothetical protein [Methanothrix sp.]